jgi:glycosidase
MYRERKQMGYPEEEIIKSLCAKSRDNARTPMQWDNSPSAGFTEGTPWCRVNPNYTKINAEEALKDQNSIFHYYKKLIRLRKEEPILIYGTFELFCPEDEHIFAYTREWKGKKWLAVGNFYEKSACFDYHGKGRALLSNYEQASETRLEQMKLRPYEASIYEII